MLSIHLTQEEGMIAWVGLIKQGASTNVRKNRMTANTALISFLRQRVAGFDLSLPDSESHGLYYSAWADNPSMMKSIRTTEATPPMWVIDRSRKGTTRRLLMKPKWWEIENPKLHQESEEQWDKIGDGNDLGDEEGRQKKMQQRHQPFLKARGESDRSPLH